MSCQSRRCCDHYHFLETATAIHMMQPVHAPICVIFCLAPWYFNWILGHKPPALNMQTINGGSLRIANYIDRDIYYKGRGNLAVRAIWITLAQIQEISSNKSEASISAHLGAGKLINNLCKNTNLYCTQTFVLFYRSPLVFRKVAVKYDETWNISSDDY